MSSVLLSTFSVFLVGAAPLEVRVLEEAAPAKAHLDAARFSCDGAAISVSSLDAEVSVRTVRAGKADCTQLVAEGPVTVSVGELVRRYQGSLRVTLEGARLRLINVVEVEPYVASVAGSAGLSGPAAIEALAIVARTFALGSRSRHARDGYHLCDRAHCQRYDGDSAVTAEARAAAERSKDQVLLIGGIILKPAHQHPACGGHTSASVDVFGETATGTAVSDLEQNAPRCTGPTLNWTLELEKAELARVLGIEAKGTALESLRRDRAGRLLELRSFGVRYSAVDFRERINVKLGPQTLPSARFTFAETDTSLRFEGTGDGHGVGLCLAGASTLAAQGASVRAILTRYFPESIIKSAP